jgi:hypothetical protein
MSHFIVTFRLKSDATYEDRYSTFTEAIYQLAGSAGFVWEETSSFCTFQAPGTASSVCSSLYLKSGFDSTKDQMVVIDLDKREKAVKGPLSYLGMLDSCLGF